jgi:hypothetical protein
MIAASPARPMTPTLQDFTRLFSMLLFPTLFSPCGSSPADLPNAVLRINPALSGRFVSQKNAAGAAKQCLRKGG